MSRKFNLDSGAEIGRTSLGTVMDEDDLEGVEVLGLTMWSTTGEVVVPHEWLEEKWEEYGLDERMLPSLPWKSSAYKRAMRFLIHPGKTDEFTVGGHRVEMNLREGEGGTNIHILEASEFIPEDESGVEGGDYDHYELIRFAYDSDNQTMRASDKVDDDHRMAGVRDEMKSRARDLFQVMQNSHIGDSVRDILYYLWNFNTDAVKMRDGGAVYFMPAQHIDTVEALAKVWEDMNEAEEVWKQGGRKAKKSEIVTQPVFATEDKVDLVERRVEQRLEEDVTRALDTAFDRMIENEDETAGEIVEAITDDLERASGMETDYNDLLGAKLSVKRILENRANEMDEEDKAEIVEEAVETVK